MSAASSRKQISRKSLSAILLSKKPSNILQQKYLESRYGVTPACRIDATAEYGRGMTLYNRRPPRAVLSYRRPWFYTNPVQRFL